MAHEKASSWPILTRASCCGGWRKRAEGLSQPDELQRRAGETIWEADRDGRERAERLLRGVHTAERAAPRQP
jgi:hypothetical protein